MRDDDEAVTQRRSEGDKRTFAKPIEDPILKVNPLEFQEAEIRQENQGFGRLSMSCSCSVYRPGIGPGSRAASGSAICIESGVSYPPV